MHLFGHPGAAVSAGSVAAPVATSVSGTTLPTGPRLRGWCFPRLLPLSTQDIQYQYPGAQTTTRGRLHRHSLLTFYYTGFRQRSLCDRRHSLSLREGADSSTASAGFSSAAAVPGSSPSHDKSVDFLHSTKSINHKANIKIKFRSHHWISDNKSLKQDPT
jgi:hypothetical protein